MNTDRHFYHCASKGLEDDVLFSSVEHFIAGMNRAGLCSLFVPEVMILSFVLMDNHVHFILYGTEADCNSFMTQYKTLTCRYVAGNTGRKLKNFVFDCWMIPNKEKLLEKICYVLRNPFVAGMRILPTNYSWGSGLLMFSNGPDQNYRTVGESTEYWRRKVLGTKQVIPSNWLINENGMIWPGSYVNFVRTEAMFGTVANFMYELNQKNEDIINQEMYGGSISLHDNVVLSMLEKSAEELFGEGDLDILSVDQRLGLIRNLKRTLGVDIKQMGRLLHIKLRDLKQIW